MATTVSDDDSSELDAPFKLMRCEGSSSEAFSDNEEEKAEEKPEEKPVKARKSAGARNVSATVEFWGAEDGVEHKLDVHRFVLMDADVGYKKQTRSEVNDDWSPMEWFNLFLSDEAVAHIVKYTNLFGLHSGRAANKWKD